MKNTILVVDDEIRMRKLIKDFFLQKEYEVLEAADGEEALNIYNKMKDSIDLILLDVMMPKIDGWTVLKNIRKENSKIAVVMLTAKSEEQDALLGFELGVDEYITKPFSPKLLVAKVDAIMRRTRKNDEEIIEVSGIKIDNEGRTVSIDGKLVELSYMEFELLKFLVTNQDKALSRDKILNNVWNYEFYGDTRTIDSHIKKIRRKLGKKGKYIETIRGVGYKFQIK